MQNYPLDVPRMERSVFMRYNRHMASLATDYLEGMLTWDTLRNSKNFLRGRLGRRLDTRDRYCFEDPDEMRAFVEEVASRSKSRREAFKEATEELVSYGSLFDEDPLAQERMYCIWLLVEGNKAFMYPCIMIELEGLGDVYLSYVDDAL